MSFHKNELSLALFVCNEKDPTKWAFVFSLNNSYGWNVGKEKYNASSVVQTKEIIKSFFCLISII